MPETLLTPSTIKLFGRLMVGLQFNDPPPPGIGNNNFLQKQLAANGSNPPNFARIYAFSYEGAYYPLPRPPIFLVHGTGTPVGNWMYPSTVDQSGVAGREWDFSGPTGYTANPQSNTSPTSPNDILYWEYEKGDFSIRFDTEAGPFEQILLVAALRAGADMADRAAPRSGASLAGASLSGASLSGASLSGASLSGASLSGASLSGASLRGR
jgi:Pentapeptide repeats (8 copies)